MHEICEKLYANPWAKKKTRKKFAGSKNIINFAPAKKNGRLAQLV